jgi:hypothetical protein
MDVLFASEARVSYLFSFLSFCSNIRFHQPNLGISALVPACGVTSNYLTGTRLGGAIGSRACDETRIIR